MSNEQTQNEVTDRTNDVSENVVSTSTSEPTVIDSSVNIVHDDPVAEEMPVAQKEKVNYEVVFFVRYNNSDRPSSEEITNFFNNYGAVHHVNCPEGRNYAFVFMSSLSTTAEHRRTRTTISQIIHDMTPENRFHITVASSNRGTQYRGTQYNGQRRFNNNRYGGNYRSRHFGRFRRPRYSGQRSQYDNTQEDNNGQRTVRHNRYQGSTESRRPYVRNGSESNTEQRPRQQRRPEAGSYRTNEASFVRSTSHRQGVRRPEGQPTQRTQRTQRTQ
ncbi:putative low complexity protein [Tupanvirus soda lake]|uniref:Low complexity protein n=2 Tax=Tupanvirus TaxID=2094720 RepID=A0AC62AB58_9VIRU|nr:putative low complexity protein [Tupanvirus soda lake]QKU35027.1 putative low complexity protein [Tupanvirus soda lake]